MSKKEISVDIVIPIYNEEMELEENVKKLHSFLDKNLSKLKWKIIIADNASTDNSYSIAKRLSKRFKNVTSFHLMKKGRGRAVRKAWLDSKADIVGYTDVDLSTNLSSLAPMIDVLEKDGFDIVIASRLLKESKVINRTFLREVISRLYNILLKFIFRVRFSDAQCGFKLIKRDVFAKLSPYIKNNEWFFDTELLVVSEKGGFNIYEKAVEWRDNPGSTVRVLPTMTEDLCGVLRLIISRPWRHIVL